jgi:hypothetical protein
MKIRFDKPIPNRLYRYVLAVLDCAEARIKAIRRIIRNDDTFFLDEVKMEISEASADLQDIQKIIDGYLKRKQSKERKKDNSLCLPTSKINQPAPKPFNPISS